MTWELALLGLKYSALVAIPLTIGFAATRSWMAAARTAIAAVGLRVSYVLWSFAPLTEENGWTIPPIPVGAALILLAAAWSSFAVRRLTRPPIIIGRIVLVGGAGAAIWMVISVMSMTPKDLLWPVVAWFWSIAAAIAIATDMIGLVALRRLSAASSAIATPRHDSVATTS